MKSHVYIDCANLHRASKDLGYTIDYKKFNRWLTQKFSATKIILFIGLVPGNAKLYEHLQQCGYFLVFKETLLHGGIVKGNCDAELVLRAVSDYYEHDVTVFHLVTGDGDFSCVVDFFKRKEQVVTIIAPRKDRCSLLLKKTNVPIVNLNEHYTKFSQ